MTRKPMNSARPVSGMSAAERLLLNSQAAQRQLVGNGVTQVIPAVAESPIPVLDPRNRTPDPRLSRLPRPAATIAVRA